MEELASASPAAEILGTMFAKLMAYFKEHHLPRCSQDTT
jgi:hypothetical protein